MNYFLALERTKEFFTENQYIALTTKQKNKGMVAEANLKINEGDNRGFANSGADLIKDGIGYEFKYLGNGSKPSVTETKRKEGENLQDFAKRVVDKYRDVKILFYFDDDYNPTIEKSIEVSHEQLEKIIINENVKIGNKTRLTSKNRIIKILKS